MANSTKLIFCLLLVTLATCAIADVVRKADARDFKGVAINYDDYAVEKRDIGKRAVGLTVGEKNAILERHNKLRGQHQASNMQKLEWDPALERTSQNWANNCKFDHSTDTAGLAGYSDVGENLYVTSGSIDPVSGVQSWYNEVKDYDFNTNTCKPGRMCGHYTQVVWADSKAVGCGVKTCDNVEGFGEGTLFVCQYGPTGNYVGQKPYKTGASCSQCPKNKPNCVAGLCV